MTGCGAMECSRQAVTFPGTAVATRTFKSMGWEAWKSPLENSPWVLWIVLVLRLELLERDYWPVCHWKWFIVSTLQFTLTLFNWPIKSIRKSEPSKWYHQVLSLYPQFFLCQSQYQCELKSLFLEYVGWLQMTQLQTLQGSYQFQRQAVNSADLNSVQLSSGKSCSAFLATLLSHPLLPFPIAAEGQGVKEERWRTEESHSQRLFIVNIKPKVLSKQWQFYKQKCQTGVMAKLFYIKQKE